MLVDAPIVGEGLLFFFLCVVCGELCNGVLAMQQTAEGTSLLGCSGDGGIMEAEPLDS